MTDYSRNDWVRGYYAAAVDQMRADFTHGDLGAVHAQWLWFMNEAGKCYRDKTEAPGQPSYDPKEAAMTAMCALLATEELIPDEPANLPAKQLLDAVRLLIIEAPTKRKRHPLFDWERIAGTTDKGSVRQQAIVGTSLAYLALLEHFKHPRPSPVISETLRSAGVDYSAATVRGWKTQLKKWPVAFEAYKLGMNSLPDHIARVLLESAGDAEKFVRRALKSAVVTMP